MPLGVGFRECTRDLDGEAQHVGVTILHPWLFELLLSRLPLSHSQILTFSNRHVLDSQRLNPPDERCKFSLI
jgi:hypothetical protein